MDNSTPGMNELLVQYLDGTLEGAEKESLEQQLAADAALREQFDSLQLTRESIRYYGLKEKVASIHQQMMEEIAPPVKSIRPARRILRYVASVAASLLLLVGGYLAYTFYNLSSDKVFSANYQRYELATVRDGGATESAAEKAYRDGHYQEVLRLQQAAGQPSVKDVFLAGAAALELKDNAKAQAAFSQVLQMNKTAGTAVLNDDAEYYLALALVQGKEYDQALELMHKIKNDTGHTYREKITRKLLRQVRMLKWR